MVFGHAFSAGLLEGKESSGNSVCCDDECENYSHASPDPQGKANGSRQRTSGSLLATQLLQSSKCKEQLCTALATSSNGIQLFTRNKICWTIISVVIKGSRHQSTVIHGRGEKQCSVSDYIVVDRRRYPQTLLYRSRFGCRSKFQAQYCGILRSLFGFKVVCLCVCCVPTACLPAS